MRVFSLYIKSLLCPPDAYTYSLMAGQTAGSEIWVSLAWCIGIMVYRDHGRRKRSCDEGL